jgi:catechol 2,3-dioxygenase-like lactoylglutathione lyase family enzyme
MPENDGITQSECRAGAPRSHSNEFGACQAVVDRPDWSLSVLVCENEAMQVEHILETCLYVDDLAKAEHFYHDILGLEVESRQEGRHVFFHCGRRMLLLFNPLASRESSDHFPGHGAFGPGHVAFAVGSANMTAWIDHLKANHVEIERKIDWPQGGRSVYFRDPAGNSLELATPQIWGISEATLRLS